LDYIGNKWKGFISMLSFCGYEKCSVDANGRVRLPGRFVEDFLKNGDGAVVMHGLPEGAIAIYPEQTYIKMREKELADVERIGASFAARRSLRRFGALSQPDVISRQGRVTLSEIFRSYANLEPGTEVRVIGVEIGVELWALDKWEAEFAELKTYEEEKRSRELENQLEN
jgi:DNA-binding transcriptional regulator/RsmH inhibitor MraZ